ncbi:MAG: phospholipase [Actinomycetota bacterium]|nr:phospholipase [Actinomycetota bacterium]
MSQDRAESFHTVTAEPVQWFITADERGNPDTCIDSRHADGISWTVGNSLEPLVHGSLYFRQLLSAVEQLRGGDLLLFTDWRGDPDQHLDAAGAEVGAMFAAAAARGVDVRGLLWRSHTFMQLGTQKNRGLGALLEDSGAQVLLDMRVPAFGSHHQKMVVLRHRDRSHLDIAFVGGIDLCHGRRDDSLHDGDPQALPMAKVYGDQPPWHDIQMAIRGPAVGDVEAAFRERWDDPSPLARHPIHVLTSWLHRETKTPDALPPQGPDPEPVGSAAVQILRTYPVRHPGYPFAREGERSIARGYIKALGNARDFVYVEDQYLWSREVASVYAGALRREPNLRMIFVIPGYPEQDGRLSMPPNQLGRQGALEVLREAGGDRVAIFFLENAKGTPVYVHAKVVLIDDIWGCIGSDNTNRRSWTHDSELSAAFMDSDPDGYVRSLRLALAQEHLGSNYDDEDLKDPRAFFQAFLDSAAALDAWHLGGMRGPRPVGHLRTFDQGHIRRRTRTWAEPIYRTVYDPDGRKRSMRRMQEF